MKQAAPAPAAEQFAAKKRSAEPICGNEPVEKKRVTIRKTVADQIKYLNDSGCLLQPIRLPAVAASFSNLSEEAALEVLSMVEDQQADIEDPNEFINTQTHASMTQ